MNEPHQPHAERSAPSAETPAEAAERLLGRSPYLPLRRLQCQFAGGVLAITGRLPSFYLKQVAHAVVARLDGVERVDDRIEIVEGRAR